MRGYWKLKYHWWNDQENTCVEEDPDEATLEHIAKLIKEGYTEGELLRDETIEAQHKEV